MATATTTAASVRARARAVPVWAWLVGLVAVSAAIRYAIGRSAVAPWIMVDELVYSELAKSFAETGRFLVREHATAAYGVVYPALIAPAWALFSSIPDAYAMAKAINAVLMSLAAVPAYFIARRVLTPWWSLAAAALTVAVPGMLYTGTLMTENAFYPVFLLVALAVVAWLERPTWQLTTAVVAAVALAYLTRAQALALVPAVVTAPPLLVWAQRRGRRALRDYWPMYALMGGGVLLALVVQVARGKSLQGLFGAYRVASESNYRAWDVFRWFWYHLADLDLAMGVVPLAAFLILAIGIRGLERRLQVLLVATASLTFWLVLEVAAFASVHALRILERSIFYVTPLFLIALLVWIERGAPRPLRATAVAAVVAAALPGLLPFPSLITLGAVSDTIALLPLWALHSDLFPGQIEAIGLVVVLGCAAAVILLCLVPPRYAVVLPLLVVAYFAVTQKPAEGKQHTASLGALFAGINVDRDWIDRAVGPDARVAAIWSGNTDRYSIWENEFFNRSVGEIYDLGAPLGGGPGLVSHHVTIDPDTGVMSADGRPIRSRYVLADGSVALAGKVIARDDRKGMFLYRVNGPLRQASRVEGLYPQDTWSGRQVTYTRLGCRGGSVAVQVASDPSLFTRPQTLTASVAGRQVARTQVPPDRTITLRVPLRPQGPKCVAVFDISPVVVPAVATRGQNPDPRELGLHFNSFSYRP
jgi:hypothetical protein